MRKNDLIKLLQDVKGNPEVVLWNGHVGDYMHIDKELVYGDLCKPTLKSTLKTYEYERCKDENNWNYKLTQEEIDHMIKCYTKNYQWEVNQFVTTEDIKTKQWKSKKVLYINAKLSGKTTFDRFGPLEY